LTRLLTVQPDYKPVSPI